MDAAGRRRFRDLSWRAKLCVLVILALPLCGALELLARTYWTVREKVPFTRTDLIWKKFYPEWDLSGVDQAQTSRDDETFDVLLLGGSVLTGVYGDVGPELQKGLEAKLHRPVRIVNLAAPGRTTWDSRWKYERLRDKRFDLVVVYDAINDVHLNCCPPKSFKADYSHATRFAQIQALERHREVKALAFPYTAYYLASSLLDRWHLTSRPRPEFNAYGRDVKTPPVYQANMERIVTLAQERGDRVLLMTFAYHIPPDYSEEAFKAKRLDYGLHLSAISLWGEPDTVARTIDEHNAITKKLADRYGLLFVDQQQLMPSGREYYNDICHFTEAGCQRFVANMLENVDLTQEVRTTE
jgi:hypothetical protein